jgi:hypothetical protein
MKWHRQISLNERRKLMLIHELQDLNCYEQIVQKLLAGERVTEVARWAESLQIGGRAEKWSESYWRTHLTALREKLREAKEQLPPMREPAKEVVAVAKELQKIDEELTGKSIDYLPELIKRMVIDAREGLEALKAKACAAYLFSRIAGQIEFMISVGNKMGIPLPDTYKVMGVGVKVVDLMRKLEIGENLSRHIRDTLPIDIPPYAAELAEGMKQFDEVDQNLIREYGVQVFSMIEDASNGRFKISGLDALTGRTSEAPAGTDSGTAGPDVSGSA